MTRGLRLSGPRPVAVTAAEAIAERLRVLAQPVRVRLIDALDRNGEMSVEALAEALGVSLHNVSQQPPRHPPGRTRRRAAHHPGAGDVNG